MTQPAPLNILWVSFEDCSPLFGCYNDPAANTPRVDALAQEGCLYPNAFSTSPVCSPARSGVITGMYPASIGTHHHRTNCGKNYPDRQSYEAVIPHYVKCIPEYFRKAGYYCTNNNKCDYQFEAPVTAWDESSNEAHWRNRKHADQPFFAVFNMGDTHESGMFDLDCEISTNPDDVPVPPYFPDTEKVRRCLAKHYDNINRVDGKLGKILDQLEYDGLADNTAVFLWSDHGPFPRGKRWPHDSGVHSPMIVRWPGKIEPGTRNERLVSTMDLGPTILSMSGLNVPLHLQGKAFLGEACEDERDYVHISRDRFDEMYDMCRAVRDKRFKYIRHWHPEQPYMLHNKYRNIHPIMQELWKGHAEGTLDPTQSIMFQDSRPNEELYDTQSDPHEVKNLAADPAFKERLLCMRQECERWQRDINDLGLIPEDVMIGHMYPHGEKPITKAPKIIPLGSEAYGTEQNDDPNQLVGKLLLQIQSGTQGASIAYRLNDDQDWKIYNGPLRLDHGTTTITAKAIRIGYKESEDVISTFNVKETLNV